MVRAWRLVVNAYTTFIPLGPVPSAIVTLPGREVTPVVTGKCESDWLKPGLQTLDCGVFGAFST